MPAVLADVVAALEAAYPRRLAESWDTGIGLTCGDPDSTVESVLFAVDADRLTIDEAARRGAQLLVTHHPLLFRPVQTISAGTPKGALLHRLISSGVAHLAVHTNADSAQSGVNDALAHTLGLQDTRPLQPAPSPPMDKLVVMVPTPDADSVLDALAAAGAGRVGEYSHAAFRVEGTGQFRPLAGAHPAIGERGQLASVAETRIDMVLPRSARSAVVTALRAAHPYEEPGFDITEMVQLDAADAGSGRVGELATPMTAVAFARHVSEVLPGTAGGVRITGDPHRSIRRVAVCGGAGSSLLSLVMTAGVDAYVTADLSHHAAAEFAEQPGAPTLVDVSHWASEWPWLPVAAELLAARCGDQIHAHVSVLRTDPWTTRAESPPAR